MKLPVTSVQDQGVQLNFERLAPLVQGPAVTALPTDPAELWDGREIDYLADSTNGVVWRFKYRPGSSSSYKWEFIGGAPLFAEVAAGESTTSTSYVNLATTGPSITLPLGGDYLVEIGATVNNSADNCVMSYAIGGAAASDDDWIIGGISGGTFSLKGERRKAALTAVALTAKYRVGGGTGTWSKRRISVTPVRVG